jgi:hypothetical protein
MPIGTSLADAEIRKPLRGPGTPVKLGTKLGIDPIELLPMINGRGDQSRYQWTASALPKSSAINPDRPQVKRSFSSEAENHQPLGDKSWDPGRPRFTEIRRIL